ncbi:hypothetical protein LJC22_04235 [Desulfosarcina sp. OttesenSCG-928-G10]|nr:hypothetical protein [Desulfosarcina sp. OttesenSCG-928-G10]MDL2321454.1 hypothetical protein [Desulfosarcina sp. OttesenSCG-928-B08]
MNAEALPPETGNDVRRKKILDSGLLLVTGVSFFVLLWGFMRFVSQNAFEVMMFIGFVHMCILCIKNIPSERDIKRKMEPGAQTLPTTETADARRKKFLGRLLLITGATYFSAAWLFQDALNTYAFAMLVIICMWAVVIERRHKIKTKMHSGKQPLPAPETADTCKKRIPDDVLRVSGSAYFAVAWLVWHFLGKQAFDVLNVIVMAGLLAEMIMFNRHREKQMAAAVAMEIEEYESAEKNHLEI